MKSMELSLSRFSPPQVTLLRAVVAAAGRTSALALVGGAVRDAWQGARSRDLDVAVPEGALALARTLADRLAGAFVPLDPDRGAARVVSRGHQIDVTDFRAPTLVADLAARDFTINALAVPLRDLLRRGRARIVDPTGGLADLRARRLRPPAAQALEDDPVRALRGVRLALELRLRPTSSAARAMRAVAPRLGEISAERVQEELIALLGLPDSARGLRLADRLGLLAVILPEVEAMRATRQPAPHRFTVLEHSLRAVAGCDRVTTKPAALVPFGDELAGHLAEPLAAGIERRHALKLAALLHDVAKPETRTLVDGRIRFFQHDVIGATRVRTIGGRLRLPERVTTVVERLVRHHLRPMHLASADSVTARARYRFFRDLGADTRDLLLLALVDAAAVRGDSPLAVWRHADLIRELLRGWEEQRLAAATPPLIRGEDVMQRFGLTPGPEVGRLLERAREAQALGLVGTREEALAYLDSPGDDS